MTNWLPKINFIQILVSITFIAGLLFLPRDKKNRILLAILFICFMNELISYIFLIKHIRNGLLFTVDTIIHNSLWLFLMHKLSALKMKLLIVFYLLFSIYNLFFIEGRSQFNYYTFIIGAFLYLAVYIFYSFYKLQKEEFEYFFSNIFLLLSAPILLFCGLSFIFGFKSKVLSATIIFGDMNLYGLIGTFINLIYYALLNIYILREKRTAHAK